MNEKFYETFRIFVYLFLLSLSVILCLVAIGFVANDDSKSILINLSTELGGAAIVFFLVDKILQTSSPHKILQKINTLEKKISGSGWNVGWDNSKEIKEQFNINELIKSSKEVLIVGYHPSYFVNNFKNDLLDSVCKGLSFRVCFMKNKSIISEQYQEQDKEKNTVQLKIKKVESILNSLETEMNKQKKCKGSIKKKYLTWIPSISAISIKKNDGSIDLKITINPITPNINILSPISRSGRISLIFNSIDNPTETEYYSEQLETLWATSEEEKA